MREMRRRRYLEEWPVERQLEAITEAEAGRPEKLQEMTRGFATIRESLPFTSKEVE